MVEKEQDKSEDLNFDAIVSKNNECKQKEFEERKRKTSLKISILAMALSMFSLSVSTYNMYQVNQLKSEAQRMEVEEKVKILAQLKLNFEADHNLKKIGESVVYDLLLNGNKEFVSVIINNIKSDKVSNVETSQFFFDKHYSLIEVNLKNQESIDKAKFEIKKLDDMYKKNDVSVDKINEAIDKITGIIGEDEVISLKLKDNNLL